MAVNRLKFQDESESLQWNYPIFHVTGINALIWTLILMRVGLIRRRPEYIYPDINQTWVSGVGRRTRQGNR